jgi:hypothetical protein
MELYVDHRIQLGLLSRLDLTVNILQIHWRRLQWSSICEQIEFWLLSSIRSFKQKRLDNFRIQILVADGTRGGIHMQLVPLQTYMASRNFLEEIALTIDEIKGRCSWMHREALSNKSNHANNWLFRTFAIIINVLLMTLILSQYWRIVICIILCLHCRSFAGRMNSAKCIGVTQTHHRLPSVKLSGTHLRFANADGTVSSYAVSRNEIPINLLRISVWPCILPK